MRERFKFYFFDIESEGRLYFIFLVVEIVDIVNEFDVFIGLVYVFIFWISFYKEYDLFKEVYNGVKIYFFEFGFLVDSEMVDMIKVYYKFIYFSNSDVYLLMFYWFGREFNCFEVNEVIFEEIWKVILKCGRKIVFNVGFDLRFGKYYFIVCFCCYIKYFFEEVKVFCWKCLKCGGRIKKGVRDRIFEFVDIIERLKDRLFYLYFVFFVEIIVMVFGKGVEIKVVRFVWERFLWEFGSEIRVFVDVFVEELVKVYEEVVKVVWVYRKGKFIVIFGGGGKYGEIKLLDEVRNVRIEDLEIIEVEVFNVEEKFK